MAKKIDLTGRKFGRLTVLREHEVRSKNGRIRWLCLCECGKTTIVIGYSLCSGDTNSCGCLRSEIVTRLNVIHGDSVSLDFASLYSVWANMKYRCSNIKSTVYKNYGERGIKVCDEWVKSYTSFKCWALENGYMKNLTIDRIDNNGNYEPCNCRWATNKEQARNKRNTLIFELHGESKTLAEWCDIYGIGYDCVYGRINKSGYGLKRALTEPVHCLQDK